MWNRIIAKRKESEDNINDIEEKKYLVDPVTKEVDVQKLMARDLPFNPSVMMPPTLSMEEKIQIHHLKTEVSKIVKDI